MLERIEGSCVEGCCEKRGREKGGGEGGQMGEREGDLQLTGIGCCYFPLENVRRTNTPTVVVARRIRREVACRSMGQRTQKGNKTVREIWV